VTPHTTNSSHASPAASLPLVSVIMPTRNRAELLKRSIASVLAQTYRNLELIVVNDASTDHTREALAAVPDPRVRVIHREKNAGAAAARNAGIAAARGDLVSFQDDDDFWLVQKLEKQVAALAAAPEAAWCLCGYIRIARHRNDYIGGAFHFKELDFSRGMGWSRPDYSLIATPSWLVRLSAFGRVGVFDERLRSWDDWELGLRLFDLSAPCFVDQPLFVQDHVSGMGMMANELGRAKDLTIIMEKHGQRWASNRNVLSRHYYLIGRMQNIHDPNPAAGRVWMFKSLRLVPFRMRTWFGLALSYCDKEFTRRLTLRFRRLRIALIGV
jgi:glycosyltransferase involved in cell wall biosynthesis